MKNPIKNGLHVLIIMLSLQLLSSTIQSDIFEAIDRGDEKQVIEETKKLTEVPYNKQGQTPLHRAFLRKNWKKIITILLNNANNELKRKMLLAPSKEGLTPLHFTLHYKKSERLQSLLSGLHNELRREMLLAHSQEGQTPLHYALTLSNPTLKINNLITTVNDNTLIMEMLFKKNKDNETALELAKKTYANDQEIIKYLEEIYSKYLNSPLTKIQNLLTLLKTKLVELLRTVQALQK